MKKQFKELKKKLCNSFPEDDNRQSYAIYHSVNVWLEHCGITPTTTHVSIITAIYGAIPLCYQESDRLEILNYLATHKYKDFCHV
jgi:hypothetical protein